MPREKVVTWRLQEGKEGYVPSQSDRRENTGVLEHIRFMSDQIMYDTLSEGKRNNIMYEHPYNIAEPFTTRLPNKNRRVLVCSTAAARKAVSLTKEKKT